MKLMGSLRQRIFVYSFLLVCVSQLAFFTLYICSVDLEPRRSILAQYCLTMSEALTGKDVEAADVLLPLRGLYGRLHLGRPGHGMWVESEDGEVLLGQFLPGFSRGERESGEFIHMHREGVRIWEKEGYQYLAVYQVPVAFKQKQAFLYNAFFYDKTPPVKNIFYHGFILLLLIGGFFSFWIARRVAWPLQRLGEEVRGLSEEHLEKTVTESGGDEVAEVARSINALTHKLHLYLSNRDDLIANISHELRSPLARISVILGILRARTSRRTEWIGCGGASPDFAQGDVKNCKKDVRETCSHSFNAEALQLELEEYFGRLEDECSLMEQLVDTTLFSEKLRVKKNVIDMGEIDFSHFCASEFARNKFIFERVNVETEVFITDGLHILGDASLLHIVCSNLFNNAVKYTYPGGKVVLSLYREGRDVVLSLWNSHPFVAEEKLERFFEPFYRAGLATGNGAGLGLALVRTICASHGASIIIANSLQYGEQGLCASIHFPAI